MKFIAYCIATFAGIGYFPFASGTAATAAGIGAAYLVVANQGLYFGLLGLMFAVGVIACGYVEKDLGKADPGIAVIDEVVGVWIALWGLPLTAPVMICGFFLFRAFDMFKIYPINRLEALPGGWGIMLDDVMAGLYTQLTLQLALRWAGVI